MYVMQLIAVAAINDATHLGNLGALSASRAGQHMGRKVDGFVDRRIRAANVHSAIRGLSWIGLGTRLPGTSAAKRRSILFRMKEVVMDWNRVEGNWKQVKGKVKEQWGKLTDDDLDRIAGKRDQLEGKIQERYGIERDRARRDIDDWYTRQDW